MLFQRLYNWIKYKSLPTSFFFKNRLFIERDTKHKRIYNLFGIVFKNSKWANFELFNIKPQFSVKYNKIIKIVTIIFIWTLLCVYKKSCHSTNYFSSYFNLLSWLSFDAVDYYLTFVVWTSIFIFYAIIYLVYDYFIQHFLITSFVDRSSSSEKKTSFFNFFNKKFKNKTNTKLFNKNELKLLLYYWLNNNKLSSDHKIKFFETLFDTDVNKTFWKKHHLFYSYLFKSTYFCNLMQEKFTTVFLNHKFNYLTNEFSFINLFKNCNSFAHINNNSKFFFFGLWYNFNLQNYFFFKRAPRLMLTTQYLWNLNELHTQKSFNSQFKQYTDSFYLLKWNTNLINAAKHLTPLLENFEQSLSNHHNSIKWNRWLYRYSILHRRVLKNSHKLTISKRLFNSGFYNKDLIQKNTWMTHRWEKANSEILSNLNSVFYSNFFFENKNTKFFFLQNATINYSYTRNQFNFFSFYENSFFWVLKRYFLFNTLSNNTLKTTYTLKKLNNKITNFNKHKEIIPIHFFVLTKMASIFSLNTTDYVFFNIFTLNDNTKNIVNIEYNNYFIKDFFLDAEELDFFNNDFLDAAYWITSNSNNLYSNYFFHTYINSPYFFIYFWNNDNSNLTNDLLKKQKFPTVFAFSDNYIFLDILFFNYFKN